MIDKILSYLYSELWGILGIFFSWLITHVYYKKSLRQQSEEASKEIKQLLNTLSDSNSNKEILKLKQLEIAVEEFKQKGTPRYAIDSFDISKEEKADLYDKACLRKKGRIGKNPYR